MTGAAGLPLALTMGDPAGIGPDITLLAYQRRQEAGLPAFALLGHSDVLRERARRLGLTVAVEAVPDMAAAKSAFARALPVIETGPDCPAEPGVPDARNAAATIAAIDGAVALVSSGQAAAVVTNPIAKHVLHEAGFSHPGHTEYLAELAAAGGPAPLPVMMLWSPALAVVPVTIHVALRAVPDLLTTDLIVRTARIVARDLQGRFGIASPRLALAGLNPHAGENGAMGHEDQAVVRPAVEQLAAEGIRVTGPHPADTLFHAAARERYDAALCMYHDQALIPIKTIAFDEAVNVTLGLPFVRTSPDHGTAFDIAGTGAARPDSLMAAMRLAARMAARTAP